jgi:hypothetical protein
MEEFRQLKSEIAALMVRIETLARYSLLVPATIFSWLATKGVGTTPQGDWCLKLPKPLYLSAWGIPLVFALLSAIAAGAAMIRGLQMGAYIKRLEQQLGAKGFGWESTLERKGWLLTPAAVAFWAVLFASTTYALWTANTVVAPMTKKCAEVERMNSDMPRTSSNSPLKLPAAIGVLSLAPYRWTT